jgi:asparagine synthase (glutamine-hydrolysing)
MRSKTDRTLGVLLSGGLDSAAVLAFATEATNGPLPAFTLGFDDDARFDERDAAAVTANILDAAHHTFSFDVDPGPLLREIVTTTGELLADASLLPTALVCRRAREHAVVLLCGDGSDELLLGYRRHAIARAATRWPFPLRRLAASCGRLLPGSRHRDGAAALAERPEAALADLVGLLPRAPWRELVAGAATGDDPLTRSYASYPTLPDGGAYAGWLDLNTYLPGDLLPKIDRASMLSGVEVWSPFLDVRVVELALRIPARTRQGLLRGKAPLRRLLSRRLPPAVLRRKKRGFGVPLARWMQTSRYGPFCREVLGDLNEPFYGVLRSGSALPLLDRVVGGEDRLAPFVHACVVLALFHDAHLRGNES